MLGLPRRWIRQIGYFLVFLIVASALLLIANYHNVVYLENYLPSGLIPSFFQPTSDSLIIDISINNCFRLNSKNENCGLPNPADGPLGNLHEFGGWVKIDKDLTLGTSWYNKKFFSYKRVKPDVLRNKKLTDVKSANDKKEKGSNERTMKKGQVVVDIAVSNPQIDSKIKGNEKLMIPVKILNDFHSDSVFNDNDHEALIDTEKSNMNDEKSQVLKADKDKPETSKAEKMRIKLEEAKKEEEEQKKKELEEESGRKDVGVENPPAETQNDQSDEPKGKKASKSDASLKVSKEIDSKKLNKDTIKNSKDSDNTGNEKKVKDKKKVENNSNGIHKRITETSRHALDIRYKIPKKEELTQRGWHYKSNGIWLKYDSISDDAITGIDILFGEDAVEPRPNWNLLNNAPLRDVGSPSDKKAFLTFRKGPKVDYKKKEYQPTLKVNKNGKFKILQVADLHFSTGVGKCRDPSPAESNKGCKADPRTLKFLDEVLDIESPDLVVLTGDQIFGDEAPDSETAVFKALYPFIKRKIPFAVTMGNHDDEGSLSRSEIMSLSASLPYSVAALGPEEVAGVGNYVVTVEGPASHNPALSLYFMDTHKYSQNPKVAPGYDWLKESQLKWVELEYASLKKSIDAYSHIHLSMAFFHIPLTEYKNLDQPYVGQCREGVTAPRHNSGARSVLGEVGVKIVSVGHDHCNDYCLLDSQSDGTDNDKKMWLCYGGGSGEGGYGGYDGYIRRLRVFEIDTNAGEIVTWKRAENDPKQEFDGQVLVKGGNAINP